MLRRLPRTDNCFFDFRNLSCIWKLSFIEVSSVEPLDYSHALLWKKGSVGGSSKMRITGQWACVVFVLACGVFICIKFDKNIKRQRIPLFRYLTLYMLCIWHQKRHPTTQVIRTSAFIIENIFTPICNPGETGEDHAQHHTTAVNNLLLIRFLFLYAMPYFPLLKLGVAIVQYTCFHETCTVGVENGEYTGENCEDNTRIHAVCRALGFYCGIYVMSADDIW